MGNETTAKAGEQGKNRSEKGATKAATPWGNATVVEEVRVAQRVGDRRFASVLQLLEDDRGQPLVRMAYTTDGATRRGPVTLRPRDIEKLRAALTPGSRLAAAFGWATARGGTSRSAESEGDA
jgi:hypothetical protein